MGQLLLIVLGVIAAVIVGIWVLSQLVSLAFSFLPLLLLVALGVGIGFWLAKGRGRSDKPSRV